MSYQRFSPVWENDQNALLQHAIFVQLYFNKLQQLSHYFRQYTTNNNIHIISVHIIFYEELVHPSQKKNGIK